MARDDAPFEIPDSEPEEVDLLAAADDGRAGRIVEPGSEVDALDDVAESVGDDVGGDSAEFSAEEAAMHVVDEDADIGLSYDEDPGYVDE